jgi:hypothetical protein
MLLFDCSNTGFFFSLSSARMTCSLLSTRMTCFSSRLLECQVRSRHLFVAWERLGTLDIEVPLPNHHCHDCHCHGAAVTFRHRHKKPQLQSTIKRITTVLQASISHRYRRYPSLEAVVDALAGEDTSVLTGIVSELTQGSLQFPRAALFHKQCLFSASAMR